MIANGGNYSKVGPVFRSTSFLCVFNTLTLHAIAWGKFRKPFVSKSIQE